MYRYIYILVLAVFLQPAMSTSKSVATRHILPVTNGWSGLDEECLKETGIAREEFVTYRDSEDFSKFFTTFEGNRSCYYLCVGKKNGDMDSKGIFTEQFAVRNEIPDERLQSCANENDADPCVTLKQTVHCLLSLYAMDVYDHKYYGDAMDWLDLRARANLSVPFVADVYA